MLNATNPAAPSDHVRQSTRLALVDSRMPGIDAAQAAQSATSVLPTTRW